MSDADTHKYVGNHPQDLDGRMLAPGETFTPTKEQLSTVSMNDMLMGGRVMVLNQQSQSTAVDKGGVDK